MDLLKYYSNKKVQEILLKTSKNREVTARFQDSFGKRPDTLQFENDILEFVKKGATSFHFSEEHWSNPLMLQPGMSKSQLDNLRIGWDLILDIDGPFEFSKITTNLIVEALKFHDVENLTVKFSVTGDTPLLIKNKKKIELKEIKEVINELKDKKKIKVLSLNKKGYITYNKINGYLKHTDKIMEVYHQQNKFPIKITPHHSVFVWKKGKIIIKKGLDLTTNDHLITYNSSRNLKRENKEKIEYNFYYGKNGKTKVNVCKKIKITKDLMRLIGYYLSEGHITKTIYQIGFSFNIKEKEYITDCTHLLKKIYRNKKISMRNPNKSTQQILIHSKEIYEFFYQFCGKGAKNKHLPHFIWELPYKYIKNLLIGYINGDAHKTGKYDLRIKSVSKKLIIELVWLCKLSGISCSLYKEESRPHKMPQGSMFKGSLAYIIRIPKSEMFLSKFQRKRNKFSPYPKDKTLPTDGLKEVYYQVKPKKFNKHRKEQVTLYKKSANIERIKKVIKWFKNYKSKDFNKKSKEIIKNYENLIKSDINTLKINKIGIKNKEEVYDISVENTENFFGGNYPILLHNSGNKGFHIAIPFNAFPDKVDNKNTKDLFPDGPRVIASYLKEMIKDMLTSKLIEKIPKEEIKEKFDPFSIVDIDTILISNRHMFRSPYSYHEKSGLISIPINKNNILNFDKEQAKPENISFDEKFLSECNKKEASNLIIQAFDWNKKLPQREINIQKQYPEIKQKVSMELFPSSIKKGLLGLEDGKKRFLFVLLNFLRYLNYDYDEIEKIVMEWNNKNKDKLKEGYIRSQIIWHRRQKKILPPNYSNKAYYDDIGLKPLDNELKFKNPVNYSLSLFRAKRR